MQPDVRKVLVVDDSTLILSILKDTLEMLPSVSVTALDNAHDAVNLASKGDYALVLLDVEMPGMSGLEALDELGQRGFDTRRIVVCSGNHTPELGEELNRRHVEFLQKPVEPQRLFLLLQQRWGVEPPAAQVPPREPFPTTPETLQNFNGNVELYERSLVRFLNEYRRWLDVISLGSEFSDLKDYRFFLHTLKGVSAYLGAAVIVQKVGLLQDAIHKGTPRPDLLLRETGLLAALQRFLRNLTSHFPKAAAPEPTGTRGQARAPELLARLLGLIERHDTDALDAVRQIDPKSLPKTLRNQFQDLVGLVVDYEFERAETSLKVLLNTLGELP